jgi:hypothetical protein
MPFAPRSSEELEEFFHGKAAVAYQRTKGSHGKLFVLRNGQVYSDSGFDHKQMTADLPERLSAGLLKGPGGLFS